MLWIRWIVLACCIIPLMSASGRQPTYAPLHAMMQMAAEAENTTVTISSQLPDVAPSDIELTIEAATGPIVVRVDDDGQLIDFPMDEALYEENPPIRVNQPRDTIILELVKEVTDEMEKVLQQVYRIGVDRDAHRIRYRVLHMAYGRVPEWTVQSGRTNMSIRAISRRPLVLEEAANPNAYLSIHHQGQDVRVSPNRHGRILVPVSEALWRADPWVTFHPALTRDWRVVSPIDAGQQPVLLEQLTYPGAQE